MVLLYELQRLLVPAPSTWYCRFRGAQQQFAPTTLSSVVPSTPLKASMASRAESVQLNKRVLSASTVHELLDVVSDAGQQFNSVNVATAMHRLAIRFRAASKVCNAKSRTCFFFFFLLPHHCSSSSRLSVVTSARAVVMLIHPQRKVKYVRSS